MRDWERRLAEAGCRITEPRRVVAQVLLAAEEPLSHQEIYECSLVQHHTLGLVTVYRTVALLESLGLVLRIHRSDGCHAYVSCSPGHRHALICWKCGRAVEFPGGDDLESLARRVELETGYRVDGHLLQLEGLCPRCQGKRPGTENPQTSSGDDGPVAKGNRDGDA